MIISQSKNVTKKWKEFVLEKYNYKCAKCGTEYNLIAHHIINKHDRPDLINDTDNGIALCRRCHIKVHQKQGEFVEKKIDIRYLIENISFVLDREVTEKEKEKIEARVLELREIKMNKWKKPKKELDVN